MKKASKFFLMILAVALLFVLIVLGVLDEPIAYTRFLVARVNAPIYRLSVGIKNYFSALGQFSETIKRLETLETERLSLVARLIEQTELRRENEELREALRFMRDKKLKLVPALIFARVEEGGLTLWGIDIGREQQVEKGDAVVNEQGVLLGTIWQVDTRVAKVLLISNQKSKIGAEVLGANNFGGVVEGQYGLGLVLTTIPKDSKIKPQDVVMTSGLENQVARGLLIGEVVNVLEEAREPFNKAILRNFVDPQTVHRVFVVKK